jgi:hypothetical protein
MRPAWRSAWAMTASFAVVFGAAIAVFDYMFWPHCDRGEKVLARDDQGRSIVSVLEACTSLGTETAESIELQSASGDKKPIFKYEPNGGVLGCKGRAFPTAAEPSVDWSSPRVIHISIPVVSSILEKHDALDGIRVTYNIGPVLLEVCGHIR